MQGFGAGRIRILVSMATDGSPIDLQWEKHKKIFCV